MNDFVPTREDRFSFDVAERMLADGIIPDAISTDIHQVAVQGPAFDMPTTMTAAPGIDTRRGAITASV